MLSWLSQYSRFFILHFPSWRVIFSATPPTVADGRFVPGSTYLFLYVHSNALIKWHSVAVHLEECAFSFAYGIVNFATVKTFSATHAPDTQYT